jgi:hypothetical protein
MQNGNMDTFIIECIDSIFYKEAENSKFIIELHDEMIQAKKHENKEVFFKHMI